MEKNRKPAVEHPADPRQRQPGGDPREKHKEPQRSEQKPGRRIPGDGRDRSDREAIDRPVQLDREKSKRPDDTTPAK
jgi:hypothetical protein